MLTLIPLESNMLSLALWDPVQSHLHTPGVRVSGCRATCKVWSLSRGSIVVAFWGSSLESYKVIPEKELLWSLWVSHSS